MPPARHTPHCTATHENPGANQEKDTLFIEIVNSVQQRRRDLGGGIEQTSVGEASLGIEDGSALCMRFGPRNERRVSR